MTQQAFEQQLRSKEEEEHNTQNCGTVHRYDSQSQKRSYRQKADAALEPVKKWSSDTQVSERSSEQERVTQHAVGAALFGLLSTRHSDPKMEDSGIDDPVEIINGIYSEVLRKLLGDGNVEIPVDTTCGGRSRVSDDRCQESIIAGSRDAGSIFKTTVSNPFADLFAKVVSSPLVTSKEVDWHRDGMEQEHIAAEMMRKDRRFQARSEFLDMSEQLKTEVRVLSRLQELLSQTDYDMAEDLGPYTSKKLTLEHERKPGDQVNLNTSSHTDPKTGELPLLLRGAVGQVDHVSILDIHNRVDNMGDESVVPSPADEALSPREQHLRFLRCFVNAPVYRYSVLCISQLRPLFF